MRRRLAGLLLLALPAPLCAAPSLAELAARLQKVEDQLAIMRVITDYPKALDARDFDGYAALFAKDGEWVNGATRHKGPAAIRKMLVGIFGAPPPGYVNAESYHISSNAEVTVDGDRATARSRHLLVMRGAEGQPVPMLAGRYEDEFVRENGQWKILRRVDYPVMPTPEEWRKVMAARRAAGQ
jgi:uncharacterized protein (TIGR02246 family)